MALKKWDLEFIKEYTHIKYLKKGEQIKFSHGGILLQGVLRKLKDSEVNQSELLESDIDGEKSEENKGENQLGHDNYL